MTELSTFGSALQTAIRRRLLFVAFVGTVMAFGLLFPFPVGGRLWSEVFNLAHAPAFCGILILIAAQLDPAVIRKTVIRKEPPKQRIATMTPSRILILALMLMIAGTGGELMQTFAGRHSSISDILANTLGLVAGGIWLVAQNLQTRIRSAVRFGAVFLIAAVSANPALNILDCIQQINSFPQLASFERPRELSSWYAQNAIMVRSTDWSVDGSHSMKLTMEPLEFSGTGMNWLEGDWSRFRELRFSIFNPSENMVPLILRIEDHAHELSDFEPSDRFQQVIELAPKAVQEIQIPIDELRQAPQSREMDVTSIRQIELYCYRPPSNLTIYLDHVHLVAD
ncbi:MAG: hypothetical protein JNL58_22395 [Planctomyces sp.]|nr:hypothetical protein [Planctomyces sp.]